MTKKADTSELIVTNKPSYLMKMDSNRGSEDVTAKDIAIPRLVLLQDLSPQIKPSKAEFIEGAKAGMFFNNVTNQLYTTAMVVPAYYKKEWVIWKDRNSGGGFKGAYPSELKAVHAMEDMEDSSICEIKDTSNHFVIIISGDSTSESMNVEEVVISMSGGTAASSRKFNSLVRMHGGDRFSNLYRMSSTVVSGNKGEYFSFAFERLGYAPEKAFLLAEKMYEAVRSGEKSSVAYEDKSAPGNQKVPGDNLNF